MENFIESFWNVSDSKKFLKKKKWENEREEAIVWQRRRQLV